MAKPGTVIIKTRAAATSNQAVAPVSNIFPPGIYSQDGAGGNTNPHQQP